MKLMKRLCFLLLNVFLWQAMLKSSHAEVLYDVESKNTLQNFRLFLEGPLQILERPQIKATDEGLKVLSSKKGGFTLYKFADVSSHDFDVRLTFTIPAGVRFSNSGVYFLFFDPTVPVHSELNPFEQKAFESALENARKKAQKNGVGPYEADFFAREIQIIAGHENGLPSDNHGAGAFYGVTPVEMGKEIPGTQGHSPYELFPGDTYEMQIEVRGTEISTFLRSTKFQRTRILVSRFSNVERSEDPILGGIPVSLLLQAFPSNGRDVKGPIFKKIEVVQY